MQKILTRKLLSSALLLFFLLTNLAVLFCGLQLIASVVEPIAATVKNGLCTLDNAPFLIIHP